MTPITIKQQKFSRMSSIMQPELMKIQQKYKGKTDTASRQNMALEQQAVYEKYGANPAAGCLPMLITLPIVFAMYRVVQNIPAYVDSVKNLYQPIADGISNTQGHVDILKDMAKTAGAVISDKTTSMSPNQIIDVLSHFKTNQWDQLAASFPALKSVILEQSKQIIHVNSLFGSINLSNLCGWGFPGIIFPILAAVTQWIQSKLMQASPNQDKDNPSAAAMKGMTTFMPIVSGLFLVMMPIGIGIYWIGGAIFTIIQQIFVNKYLDKIDINELVEKGKEKTAAKRAKVAGVTSSTLRSAANTQTKNLSATNGGNSNGGSKKLSDIAKMSSTQELKKKSEVSSKAGSIAQNANLLKNRYNDKGEK